MGRDELESHELFAQVSPAVGELDEAGFEAAMEQDADGALTMLPDLVSATDEQLRARARRLAGRVVVDRARRGTPRQRGIGRPQVVPADRPGADLDVDASMDGLIEAHRERRPPGLADLRARDWGRATMAVCLVVDRSGSMAGDRLAAAALAAAACAWRAPEDHAVLVFSGTVIAVQAMGRRRESAAIVNDLLAVRGKGTTDLAAALHGAGEQLQRSRATRKVCILLSDCQDNGDGDPVAAASRLDELVVVAPADDGDEAVAFCRRAGARSALASGPTATVSALAGLLS